MTEDVKQCPKPAELGTFGVLERQLKQLDDVLVSIKGFTDESKLVRTWIVAQIEAIGWALRQFDE